MPRKRQKRHQWDKRDKDLLLINQKHLGGLYVQYLPHTPK